MSIRGIAVNTFKEAARNKVFYLLVFFGVFFALSSQIMGILTVGDRIKVLKDVGLAAIHFFSVLVAVFTGINLVYKEIEKKTIYNILSKPVSRQAFIMGKFAGLALTVGLALLAMSAVFFAFLLAAGAGFQPVLLVVILFIYLQLLIVIAVSILFSSFSTPILSSIFTLSLFLIGQTVWTFNHFKDKIVSPVQRFIAELVYYLLPNLEKFNLKNSVVLGESLDPGRLLLSAVYGLAYVSALLCLTVIIFRRRQFP